MKKSREIRLTLLHALAASAIAAGCGSRQQEPAGWQACVDANGTVADDRRCQDEPGATHPVGYVPLYRWYYYRPYGGDLFFNVPSIGQRVPAGGSYSLSPFGGVAHSGRVSGSVSRGGFGSTASGKAGA